MITLNKKCNSMYKTLFKQSTNQDKEISRDFFKKLQQETKTIATNFRGIYEGTNNIEILVSKNTIIDEDNLFQQMTNIMKSIKTDVMTKTLIHECTSENVKNILNINCDQIIYLVDQSLQHISYNFLSEYNKKELTNVKKNLKSNTFFNMTNEKSDPKIAKKLLSKGQNFTPPIKYNQHTALKLYNSDLITVLNTIFWQHTKTKLNLTVQNFNQTMLKACSNTKLPEEHRTFFMNIIENKEKIERECEEHIKTIKYPSISEFYMTEKELFKIFENESSSFIQSDKNIGFVKITDEQLLVQFLKLNKKQGFIKSNIIEETYLDELSKIKQHLFKTMPEEIQKKLHYKLLINLQDLTRGEIGIMRLLPKILKLKNPSNYTIDELTSRGIKSSLKDPINSISSILAELSKELYENLKAEFERKFKIKAPPKTGSDEAMSMLKTETLSGSDWKETLEASGDFTDMYSNAKEDDLKDAYKLCFVFSNFNEDSQIYILTLLHIILQFNFFKEPSGIFTSKTGFAMGCMSSAISTDILLLASEYTSFLNLTLKQISSIKRYIRFRDDVSVRLQGKIEEIIVILKILITGYPSSIDFNIKITYLHNTFLNLRFYIIPNKKDLSISILRKIHDKHDIVQSDSYNNPQYVGAALSTSAYNICQKTNHRFHKRHQYKIYKEILSAKGYKTEDFNKRLLSTKKKLKSETKTRPKMDKKYGGKITYDSVTKIHTYIIKLLKVSKFPKDTALPIAVGAKKVKNYVFTKQKFYKKLKKLYQENN